MFVHWYAFIYLYIHPIWHGFNTFSLPLLYLKYQIKKNLLEFFDKFATCCI